MNDSFFYTKDPSPIYHDLRPIQDDLTILRNPHKGWYFHYVDNGFRFKKYRSTIREDDDLKWLPGLNHMYLRFDWSDIEEKEGVFDWSPIDDIMAKWGPLGYRFSIRICTFEANRPMIPYSTPKWVFDKGAKGVEVHGEGRPWLLEVPGPVYFDAVEPDYGDPVYFSYLERFMAEFGQKYNGDPRIDFIDVGTVGQYGEGSSISFIVPPDVLRRHVDLHLKNFPDTFILVNDGMIKHAGRGSEPEATFPFAEYCAARGMGMRDDSLYVESFMNKNGYTMLSVPTAFDLFWKTAPVDLESAHMLYIDAIGFFDDGFRYIEAMKRAHATYAGFHGDPYKWYEKHRNVSDYAANRLGYWFFPEGYKLADVTAGTDSVLKLYVTNRGFAPAYHSYSLRITLTSEDGSVIGIPILSAMNADCRSWLPDKMNEVVLKLKTRTVPPGKYALNVGLFWNHMPVLLAVRQDRLNPDGTYCIGSVNIES